MNPSEVSLDLPTTSASTSSRSSTCAKVICFEHSWTIEKYSQYDSHVSPGNSLISAQFYPKENDKIRFSMALYPKGYDQDKFGDWASLFIRCDAFESEAECEEGVKEMSRAFTVKFSVLNDVGQMFNRCVDQKTFAQDSSYGWMEFIRRSYLLLPSNRLLPDQRLTLHCEVSYISTVTNSDVTLITNADLELARKAQRQIITNLSALFQTMEHSDLVIQFDGGYEIKCHKNILNSCSPVFMKMIKQGKASKVKGKQETVVTLPNMNPNVFCELLRFVYTGKIPYIDNCAVDLLLASEKYQLDVLKLMCQNYISTHLPPDIAHKIIVRLPLAIMPDLPLLTVFDHFPIKTLFDLGKKVCQRWKKLLRSACNRRTVLTLLAGGNEAKNILFQSPFNLPCEDDLVDQRGIPVITTRLSVSLVGVEITRLQKQRVQWLCANFPNLTSLQLVICNDNCAELFDQLEQALRKYTTKLTSLKLRLNFYNNDRTRLESLFTTIGTLSTLKHLTFENNQTLNPVRLGNTPLGLNETTQVSPPLPPLLEELHYQSYYSFNVTEFVRSVRDHSNLKRIAINIGREGILRTEFMRQIKHISKRIVSMPWLHTVDNVNGNTIDKFCELFTSLTTLKLSIKSLPIRSILPLSKLTQLEHLSLSFVARTDDLQIINYDPQLPSVKVLELDFLLETQALNFTQLNVSHTFPAVQVVRLDISKIQAHCVYCMTRHTMTDTRAQCIYPTLDPLKLCRQLRKVYLFYCASRGYQQWTYAIQ